MLTTTDDDDHDDGSNDNREGGAGGLVSEMVIGDAMPRDGDDVMEHVDEDNYDFRWNCATQSTTYTNTEARRRQRLEGSMGR